MSWNDLPTIVTLLSRAYYLSRPRPVALRRARQHLDRLAGRLQFVRADARKYAAGRTWPDASYDIIYTVNLFDQLDDKQTAMLIVDCRRGSSPGGVLLFGNYSPNMPSAERALIAWLMNWNIRCRPAEEWRQSLRGRGEMPSACASSVRRCR